MKQVSIYVNDQLLYQSPAGSVSTYSVHVEHSVVVVQDLSAEVTFFYCPRPGQYGKVQVLDGNQIIRINE
jgi:hypothetical protein